MPSNILNKTLMTVVCLIGGFNSSAETILQCAVNKVPQDGARINLIQNASGQIRANLIFGTTISGSMYNVTETKPGVFQGAMKSNDKTSIKLVVSSMPYENRYIRGHKATLEVVYPDVRKNSGLASFKSLAADEFTCGRQIRGYRE